MQFMINDAGAGKSSGDLDLMQRNMQQTKNEISYIKKNLAIRGTGRAEISEKLLTLEQDMKDLIKKIARMDDGLEVVLDIYRECEARILGNTGSEAVTSANAEAAGIFGGIKSWFDDLLNEFEEWKKGIQEKQERKNVQKQMQKEIKELLSSERFNKDTWKNASVEEREEILRELLQEMNRIYDIEVADLYVEPIESEPGYITYGQLGYRETDGYMAVIINEDLLSDVKYYNKIMNTMVHEMRHGYQHSVVDHPERYNVSEETIESWRNNFNDYQDSETDGFDAYWNQPVEVDARKFADKVIG